MEYMDKTYSTNYTFQRWGCLKSPDSGIRDTDNFYELRKPHSTTEEESFDFRDSSVGDWLTEQNN